MWRRAGLDTPSPKHWMDAYLAAFAMRGGQRLVTFDRAYRQFETAGLDLLLLSAAESAADPVGVDPVLKSGYGETSARRRAARMHSDSAQIRYWGIFRSSPSLRADWWATMPETVMFKATAMSTSGFRSARMAVTNSFMR